jgi:hypothetical protein
LAALGAERAAGCLVELGREDVVFFEGMAEYGEGKRRDPIRNE